MEKPKQKDLSKIARKFRDRIFFYVNPSEAKFHEVKVKPCMLDLSVDLTETPVFIFIFDEDMCLDTSKSYIAEWENLYDGWEEATKIANHYNKLYSKGFYRRPFVEVDFLESNKGILIKIQKDINKALKGYHTFKGIDFCDVGTGVQIRGYHLKCNDCCFMTSLPLSYDLSNKKHVVKDFIEMWKRNDTPQRIKDFKKFIADGKEYGWD